MATVYEQSEYKQATVSANWIKSTINKSWINSYAKTITKNYNGWMLYIGQRTETVSTSLER